MVEVVIDGCVNSDKFLQALQVSEFQHHLLSSSQREMGVFAAIVLPLTNHLNLGISDSLRSGAI
tara:strand:+ start:239 stop:430 length:192 start_codon:yes stop_codon:yes gene_type:complete